MKGFMHYAIAVLFVLGASSFARDADEAGEGAETVVERLYAAPDEENPFIAGNAKVLRTYFTDSLAKLIRKDWEASQGEVGVIDGDPRYDAQDMEIKRLRVAPATIDGEEATVVVTFENFGEKKRFVYRLEADAGGRWRIADIEWDADRSLRRALEDVYRP